MWSMAVEVSGVLTKHGAGVALVVEQDPVGALRAGAAYNRSA
jgi:hypothetical protein